MRFDVVGPCIPTLQILLHNILRQVRVGAIETTEGRMSDAGRQIHFVGEHFVAVLVQVHVVQLFFVGQRR